MNKYPKPVVYSVHAKTFCSPVQLIHYEHYPMIKHPPFYEIHSYEDASPPTHTHLPMRWIWHYIHCTVIQVWTNHQLGGMKGGREDDEDSIGGVKRGGCGGMVWGESERAMVWGGEVMVWGGGEVDRVRGWAKGKARCWHFKTLTKNTQIRTIKLNLLPVGKDFCSELLHSIVKRRKR